MGKFGVVLLRDRMDYMCVMLCNNLGIWMVLEDVWLIFDGSYFGDWSVGCGFDFGC